MVTGFASSPPNAVLMAFAVRELDRVGRGRLLDLGCGAGRNAVPLAGLGWDVTAVDLSMPMLGAAAGRGTAPVIYEAAFRFNPPAAPQAAG
jgi:2-polyprenyl-3-methyl-5-hydroxy-6-metoxy-1,4-benzoquinol methylase